MIKSINKKHLDYAGRTARGANVVKKLSFADVGGQGQYKKCVEKRNNIPVKISAGFKDSKVNKGTILSDLPEQESLCLEKLLQMKLMQII